ncbi:CAAX amino protease [Paractinoplanes deccanensis]|uniref:CAAX amino protease n=1 Tax=Paractinoplanes deccanensis TaxID=113561 RepID=A0ABQ3XYS2_9ACTN|nr:CPBP family intramembrane glutamic endopeptidase [Actinoplanes deccanensis]GID72904.1 CAAX amino protease [Actinoplanes deccanensis]
MRFLILIVTFLVADLLLAPLLSAAAGNWFTGLITGFAVAAAVLLAYRYLVRRLEHEEPPLARARPLAMRGFVLGVLTFSLVIGVIAAFGGYRIAGWGSVGDMLGTFGMMTGVAVLEEVLFRGVLFRLLERWAGTAVALGGSGVLFGGLHLLNPHATVWGALAIAAEAGLMLGAAYVATRSLWLPIGLHLGWNFAESGLFGATVSGSDGTVGGLVRGVAHGPAAISGGEFGPEASVFAILAGLVLTVVFLRSVAARATWSPATLRR